MSDDDANETETSFDFKERKRLTYSQKHKMLKFLEKHPKLKTGFYDDTFTVAEGRRLWQELAENLNSLDGPKKTWMVWKKCYRDMQLFQRKTENKYKKWPSDLIAEAPGPVKIKKQKDIKYKPILYTKIEPTVEDSEKDPLEYDKYVYRLIGETSVRRVTSTPSATTTKTTTTTTQKLHSSPSPTSEPVIEDPIIKQEPEGVFVMDNVVDANNAQEQYYKKKLDLMERQTMAFEAIAESMQMQAEAFLNLNESVNNLTSILKNVNIQQNP